MKKIFYYIIIFILCCSLGDSAIQFSIAKQIDEQSPYCLSFASIGANLLESRVDCWAKIKLTKSYVDMDQELIQILNTLDLPIKKENFLHNVIDGKKTLRYELVYNEQNYYFTLQNDTDFTYFLLTSISTKDDTRQRHEEKILENILHIKTYYRYKGDIKAPLDTVDRLKYAQIVLKCLNAKQLDCYEDENVTSISAYSPKLEKYTNSIALAGKEYNLQIALHNDKSKNQSYIYLGFPLLLNDY